jgi:hypothetical protein
VFGAPPGSEQDQGHEARTVQLPRNISRRGNRRTRRFDGQGDDRSRDATEVRACPGHRGGPPHAPTIGAVPQSLQRWTNPPVAQRFQATICARERTPGDRKRIHPGDGAFSHHHHTPPSSRPRRPLGSRERALWAYAKPHPFSTARRLALLVRDSAAGWGRAFQEEEERLVGYAPSSSSLDAVCACGHSRGKSVGRVSRPTRWCPRRAPGRPVEKQGMVDPMVPGPSGGVPRGVSNDECTFPLVLAAAP